MEQPEQDQQLIARLAAGETGALEALYDRHAGPVFTLLLRIVADRQIAEELLQEVFLRAWQHAGAYQQARGRVPSWLFGIAHNLAINEVRRQRRRPQDFPVGGAAHREQELAVLPDPAPAPPDAAWARLRREELIRALDHLPPPQRSAIALFAAGYSQSEIANRLGEPLGTVKSRMRRGLHTLRDLLQARGVESD